MRAHGLALLLLSVPGGAAAPEDAALMEDFRLKEAYDAIESLRPRIDALAREMAAFRDSHSGKTEPVPGGERRRHARRELRVLKSELDRKRTAFKEMGVNRRVQQAVLAGMQFNEGKSDMANRSFQSGLRHAQLMEEYKQYDHALEVVLDEEEIAFQAAVGRWRLGEDARLRRRRLLQSMAGSAAVLAPTIFLWRRRRRRQLRFAAYGRLLESRPPGGSSKAWKFGTRWDCADGGDGTVDSVRLFDGLYCAHPSSVERLLSTLRAAVPPRHPSIVSTLEVFPAGGCVVLVCPVTPGKPLSRWIEEGRVASPEQAVMFLKRLAPALDYAHRRGRAHGGLDPDCVLVGADGKVTLEDFGLVGALAAAGVPAAGSPAYAAPEFGLGPPAAPADFYSLGVILYELLTGQHPFQGTNLQTMKLERRYAPLMKAVPGIPPALAGLLDGLLEPDPKLRRPEPGGLTAALRAF